MKSERDMQAKTIKDGNFRLFAMLCLLVFSFVAHSVENDERRVRSGLKYFRSVLAADRDLLRKQTVDSKLLFLMVYTNDEPKADELANELSTLGLGNKTGTIRNLPIKTRTVGIGQLSDYFDKRIAGVYLTQPLTTEQLKQLIQFGVNKHLVVYSPFEGDVSKGVFIGMSIGTRVYPLINVETMKASKLRIKSLFLRVARKYES